MFLGEYRHTLDAKGRVSLPRKFRDQTGGQLVVSKGFEKSVYVMPRETWDDFLANLLDGNELTKNQRQLRRFFLGGAMEVDVDSAGRITLSPALREYAGLVKDVAVIGNGDRVELWDSGAWASYNEATAAGIEEAAEELADKGIL